MSVPFGRLAIRLRHDDRGASLVEYGVTLLVVAAVATATYTTMGNRVASNASAACSAVTVDSANPAGC